MYEGGTGGSGRKECPLGYVDATYLNALAEWLAPAKRRTYELLHIQSGDRVLDVGCGPGTDTIPLAALVGPAGLVAGIDLDERMVAEADRRAREAGVDDRVRHTAADSSDLPFADESFDCCRSERLFQHLARPECTLREMLRVTRRGGWLVVLETEYASVSIDTDLVELERELARVRAERMVRNGYAGRALYRLFKRQGLTEVRPEIIPLVVTDNAFSRFAGVADQTEQTAVDEGVMTPDDLARWHQEQEAFDREGAVFATVNEVLVVGRKP